LCPRLHRGGLHFAYAGRDRHPACRADAPGHPATDLLVFTRELVAWPVKHRLKLVPNAILSAARLAGAKMLSWVQNAALLEKAHEEGFDDALLLNEKGHLAECTSANVILVRGGRVLTPPLSSGCLPGVTREVLQIVIPQAGFELEEANLSLGDLSSAEELFISSTNREVAAVGNIDPHWTFEAPGKITHLLGQAFREYVRSHLKRTPRP
jgi:branched-chain amino acid aminotransferase